ncbi:MAG: FecR family protein [Nitrospirota bacterium]
MNARAQHDRRGDATTEAIEWVVRLQDHETPVSDRERFEAWLAAAPTHAAAYANLAAFWNGLDALAPEDVCEIEQAIEKRAGASGDARHSSRRRRRQLRVAALAASLAAATVGAGWLAETLHWSADYRTAVGEHRTVPLADGSVMEMNTGTAVSVMFSDEARRITLHEGEAMFTVAPDSSRPFEVAAAAGVTRALGTAFNVRAEDDRVTVTVLQHQVLISAGQSPPTRLSSGQQTTYGPDGAIGPVREVDADRVVAWRRGRLVFDNQPLAEVLHELSRYSRGYILLPDPALQSVSVTGVFDTTHPDRALRTIEETLPIRAVRLTDRLVLLYQQRLSTRPPALDSRLPH